MATAFLLSDLIDGVAARRPDATALSHRGVETSYAALAALQDGFAASLAGITAPGDRVAVWLGKSVQGIAAMFGTAKAGRVFVPVNPALKAPQVAHILQDCDVRVLVTSAERLGQLDAVLAGLPAVALVILTGAAPLRDADGRAVEGFDTFLARPAAAPAVRVPDDVAAIFYTSGSTGKPKGVVLPHRSLVTGAAAVAQYLRNCASDRILAAMPLSFDAGFSQLTTAFHAGATAVLLDYLHPAEAVRVIASERITGVTGVPPFWMQMVERDWPEGAVASLRYWATTGGRMPAELVEKLRRRAPGAAPYLMYGLTEAFRSTYLPPADIDRKAGSIGRAIPGQEILVLREDGSRCAPREVGELVHRGTTVALGYWNNQVATAERFKVLPRAERGVPIDEIAVFSGDRVYLDEEGFVFFVGRADEMIKTSGYRVSPTEIEDAIYASGVVAEAAAYGIADEALGQRVGVTLCLMPGMSDLEPVRRACRQALPGYMQPHLLRVHAGALPRSANGKIDRRALQAAACDAQPLKEVKAA